MELYKLHQENVCLKFVLFSTPFDQIYVLSTYLLIRPISAHIKHVGTSRDSLNVLLPPVPYADYSI